MPGAAAERLHPDLPLSCPWLGPEYSQEAGDRKARCAKLQRGGRPQIGLAMCFPWTPNNPAERPRPQWTASLLP
jgi:hypothetical protein